MKGKKYVKYHKFTYQLFRLSRIKYWLLLVCVPIIVLMTITGCAVNSNNIPQPAVSSPIPSDKPNVTTPMVSPSQRFQATYEDAPETITKQFDGQEVHANLIKYVGSLPTSDSQVTVNNNSVMVNPDGSYYVFFDLVPGKNNIEIKTSRGTNINVENIMITFTPPLIISLGEILFNRNIDYSKTPLPVTGQVNNAKAKVTINGENVSVGVDDTFSIQILLKDGIQATATLDNESDEAEIRVLHSNGMFSYSPGQLLIPSQIIIPNSTINLKANQAARLDSIFKVTKYFVPKAENCKLSMVRVSQTSYNPLPMISGLITDINPSNFTIYPNTNYHSTISFKASPDVPAGKYYFFVRADINNNELAGSNLIALTLEK